MTVLPSNPERLDEDLRAARPQVEVVDLDAGREKVLEALSRARPSGCVPPRVVGFYSHVDRELGQQATAAGVAAFARGRFWRELESILAG